MTEGRISLGSARRKGPVAGSTKSRVDGSLVGDGGTGVGKSKNLRGRGPPYTGGDCW